jgi:hypothetical protein
MLVTSDWIGLYDYLPSKSTAGGLRKRLGYASAGPLPLASTGSRCCGLSETTVYLSAHGVRHGLAAVLPAEFSSPASPRGERT